MRARWARMSGRSSEVESAESVPETFAICLDVMQSAARPAMLKLFTSFTDSLSHSHTRAFSHSLTCSLTRSLDHTPANLLISRSLPHRDTFFIVFHTPSHPLTHQRKTKTIISLTTHTGHTISIMADHHTPTHSHISSRCQHTPYLTDIGPGYNQGQWTTNFLCLQPLCSYHVGGTLQARLPVQVSHAGWTTA